MKKILIITIAAIIPAFAMAGGNSQYVNKQAELLEEHRQWILTSIEGGALANDSASCQFFVEGFSRLKMNSMRTAVELGEGRAAVEKLNAVPDLGSSKDLCK